MTFCFLLFAPLKYSYTLTHSLTLPPADRLCPESCAQKNPKVALNLWQKLRTKSGKVALKLRAIWLIFGFNMLLWSFGTLANFGNEQQNNVYQYWLNEVQKLDIFENKVFVHDNDRLYTVNYAATSLV